VFGVATIVALETVRVTGTACAVPPDGVTVIVPVKVPMAMPAGFTDTLSVAFPVPEVGATLNQLPPLVTEAPAVKSCDPVIVNVCAAGIDPFWA